MNNRHQQNDELGVLFNERKANIDTPDDFAQVMAKASSNKSFHEPKSTWKKLVFILSGASVASFGVLALISELSKPVTEAPVIYENTIAIVEAPKQIISRPTKTIIVSKPIPALVKPTPPPSAGKEPINTTTKSVLPLPEKPVVEQVPITITKNTAIAKAPLIYPKQAIKQKIEGKVTLRYQINDLGKAESITVQKSDHRLLSKAAKEALAGWHFPEQENQPMTKQHSVEFVFSLD